jgi:hypothetical protein
VGNGKNKSIAMKVPFILVEHITVEQNHQDSEEELLVLQRDHANSATGTARAQLP